MLTIRLLGRPSLIRDGRALPPPRGRKAWAVLAYVLLGERPQRRSHLAELFFTDAEDPLGALRWTLAELRRALSSPGVLTGDPVAPGLGPDLTVDIHQLTADHTDGLTLLALRGELLEGLVLPSCPEFESWLLVERQRVSATLEGRLRQSAIALLAGGQAPEAVGHAARAVALNPLEEGNHELLVRSLAMAGDGAGARRQVAVCQDLMRRELGLEPSAALRQAAAATRDSPMLPALSGRAAAASQLEAGRAAIVAGAVDAGLQCLRRAVAEATRGHDGSLRGRALAALGAALVHSVRGRDEEGSILLHQAIQEATAAGDRATAVTAHRELGFIEVQAGRRHTADGWLAAAQGLAETDAELAAVLGVRGMNASDLGDYPAALGHLTESVERSRRADDQRQEAWSLAILARAHLLRAEHHQAAEALARSLQLVQEQRWLAFLPFPQTLAADLDLDAGDVEGAAAGLERAWALACQLDDPCWEGLAARGLGRVEVRRGAPAAAMTWLGAAAVRCNRVPDRYQWVRAYVLDAMITLCLDEEADTDAHDRAGPLVTTMAALAARCDMRELVVRALVHRHRLGDPAALASARMLGASVDNPALADLLRHGDPVTAHR